MGNVIQIRDQKEWSEATLAKKSLAWHMKRKQHPGLDFSQAIAKEENLLRDFFDKVKSQSTAA